MLLSHWRKSKGLSQTALGNRCGLAGPYISQIEAGIRRPSPEAASRIEAATEGKVTAAELLGVATPAPSERLGVSEDAAQFVQTQSEKSLYNEAVTYGLNPAEIARAAVERAVKTERMKRFSEENREAIESWNELVEREGLWSDGLRAF